MDKRTVKSKLKIFQAALDLMEENDIGDITISELCEEANVDRVTFYKYYSQPVDVFEEFIGLTIDKYIKHYPKISDLLDALLNAIKDDSTAYLLLAKKNILFNMIFDKFTNGVDFNTDDKNLILFISGGIVGIICKWFQNDLAESVSEIKTRITIYIKKVSF